MPAGPLCLPPAVRAAAFPSGNFSKLYINAYGHSPVRVKSIHSEIGSAKL